MLSFFKMYVYHDAYHIVARVSGYVSWDCRKYQALTHTHTHTVCCLVHCRCHTVGFISTELQSWLIICGFVSTGDPFEITIRNLNNCWSKTLIGEALNSNFKILSLLEQTNQHQKTMLSECKLFFISLNHCIHRNMTKVMTSAVAKSPWSLEMQWK